MNGALRKPMTVEQFLTWEERQELRYEFDGMQPVAMTGGTAAHAAIQRNLAIAVGGRLHGTPCQFFGSDLKIVLAGKVRYPDGFVVCAPVARGSTVVYDPVVIFEVMSDSTARTDLVTKNREYAAAASVLRYVVLAQDEIGGTMFERAGADWTGRLLRHEDMIRMPELGIEVPLVELYSGLDFAEADSADSGASELGSGG